MGIDKPDTNQAPPLCRGELTVRPHERNRPMNSRLREASVILVGMATLAACSSFKQYPSLERSIFPAMVNLSDTEVQALIEQPLMLAEPLRASVLWLNETDAGLDAELPEAERTRLLDGFTTALSHAPFGAVATIPTALTDGGARSDVLERRSGR